MEMVLDSMMAMTNKAKNMVTVMERITNDVSTTYYVLL